VIPVHPELIRLGFNRARRVKRERGEKRVFPEAERKRRGQIAASSHGIFRANLARLGLKNAAVLSSTASSWIHRRLARAEFLERAIRFLVGHTKPTTTVSMASSLKVCCATGPDDEAITYPP
jgi:hypothetical protein